MSIGCKVADEQIDSVKPFSTRDKCSIVIVSIYEPSKTHTGITSISRRVIGNEVAKSLEVTVVVYKTEV